MKKYLLIIAFLLSSSLCFAQYLQNDKALEDLMEFKLLMEKESSYYQLSEFDFKIRYKHIENKIKESDSLPLYVLAYEMEKVIAETIDRHASVKMKNFEKENYELLKLHFPFVLASLDGNVVALKENESKGTYAYYSNKYPFVKSIKGIDIDDFLERYAYRSKHSPNSAQLTDGLMELSNIGMLYFKQGKQNLQEAFSLTLTNGEKDKEVNLVFSSKKHEWTNVGSLRHKKDMKSLYTNKDFDLTTLDKWLTDSIAYLAIPAMANYKNNANIEPYLNKTIEEFRNAKALIIDIRGNGGGTRDILNTLSGYFVQPAQTPWVANVAYVRSDQRLNEDIASMQGRYLYNYNSNSLSDKDRKAIDKFISSYETDYTFDETKFSSPFYMVLHSNESPLTIPIYILVNEESFSAASVFTSAFKGLPNVKIAGVNTNGSSGRSVRFTLKNSNITIRLSTMLSFQRNGKTLDGNGTVPDIMIEKGENQVLGKSDTQLDDLIEWIQNN